MLLDLESLIQLNEQVHFAVGSFWTQKLWLLVGMPVCFLMLTKWA
jgi:hypothetical protein